MAHEFRLPDIGEGLTEAEIVRWLVDVGEEVAADQPIVEVETDKAVVEIPSPYAGTVLEHGGAAGDVIAVGSVLVVVGDATEATPEAVEPAQESMSSPSGPAAAAPETQPSAHTPRVNAPAVPGSPLRQPVADQPTFAEPSPESGSSSISERPSVAPIVGTLSEDAEILRPRDEGAGHDSTGVKALPVVRKLARDNGVDITTVTGSGPDGRITREDVLAAIAPPPPPADGLAPVAPLETPEESASVANGEDGRQKMSRLRRTIAANMSKSWAEIPHVTTFDDVDASRLLEARNALAKRHDIKVPLEAMVVKAVLPALDAFPEFNATIDGEDLVVHGTRDIGIAVDTPEGLMVAVIQNAASMSVLDLAVEVGRLGEGARERTLSPSELTGQTFTVSNIGAVGGGHGTPIVPYGTTAILSVGRAREKAIVIDGDLVIAPAMPLSLSYDHRVIDGGVGRRFMALLMENLEEPALFLAD